MIKRILVPLDGSRLGESALPIATRIAGRMTASITLLHVIEKGAPAEGHGERPLRAVDEAQAYLDEIAGREHPVDGVGGELGPVDRRQHSPDTDQREP